MFDIVGAEEEDVAEDATRVHSLQVNSIYELQNRVIVDDVEETLLLLMVMMEVVEQK